MASRSIAIVGSGIAGMTAAYLLAPQYDVTLFEANDYVGGHTNTIEVADAGRMVAVDTGFIVYNDRNYPNFTKLLDRLGVTGQPTSMSFSVRCDRTGLEYNGTSTNALFAQRRNLFRPSFYRMIRDILRFNRESIALLRGDTESVTLGDYLDQQGYSKQFVEHYIIPMGSALWSTVPSKMFDFPARYFVQFFDHHGMLTINDRPNWFVIRGGSYQYVRALTAGFTERIRLQSPVTSVRRFDDHVEVTVGGGETLRFDEVVLATHSDQALAMLADPSEDEKRILGAIPYQENVAVLHTDRSVLPRARRAVASWNYRIPAVPQDLATVTYNMNILQTLD
ncbi:FAD-dependent oxidoreductase, partial [candidate division GN15 bacterium]|nr:FAD-dependent oxidoreductase [candidate division GN15 bacterium]